MGTPRKRSVVNVSVSSQELRNRSAQAKGYKSYYDYRAHDNGRIPPGRPRLSGEGLARARGHRSAADLHRQIREGSFVLVDDRGPRDKHGQYKWVDVKVVDPYGRERVFRLSGRQASRANLTKLAADVTAGGAVLSPSPSLDIRQA